ncbi:OsmC family protein [Vicingaceae bacterium]|nr:OsmC family protein [Vicingaceae bacterium]MDA9782797.1 OsmC family protein [Vicingaceae bacterium]MDB4061875.1 OsmC family protein [Vicingaceae bacterium]
MKDTLHANGTLGSENYLMEIKTTNHTVMVDEPESIGGSNKYPNPAQYLLSALASCTAITIKMYADKKKWNVGEINVDVKMKEVISSGKTIKKIVKAVQFENPLEDDQIERLLTIGSKCPISKLLEQPIEMEFEKQ